jgi:hypothetical protein
MSDYNNENTDDTSGQDQTEGGGEAAGGEEGSEADMIFAPEASKPGRNAGMLMVAFVMIGVGVIYFMRARGGPGKVQASAELSKADTEIKSFINDRDQIRKMTEMIKNTEKVVKQFEEYGDTPQISVEEIKKKGNIFVYVSPNQTPDDPNADEKAKSKKYQEAKRIFLEELGAIRVQYLMVSSTAKTAMINNKLIKEGQEVEGFVIEGITPTLVTVSKTVKGFEFKAEVKTSK